MSTPNEEFDIETTLDLDNIDVEAAKQLENPAEKTGVEAVIEKEEVKPAKQPVVLAEEPTEEELASYSEAVRKRIDKLVKAREDAKRDALRLQQERDEAVTFARSAYEQRKQLEEQARKFGEQSASAIAEKLDADLKAARGQLVEALNTYDTEAAADAQIKIAELTAAKREAEAKKSSQGLAQAEKPVVQPQPTVRPAPDVRAQEWTARNSAWFQKDKAMTAFVFGVHESLVVDQGIDPAREPDKYYQKLDEAVRQRFPEAFEDTRASTTPRSPVAPATRSATGRKKVTLSAAELAIARRLNVTPEQFAREKYLLENPNG